MRPGRLLLLLWRAPARGAADSLVAARDEGAAALVAAARPEGGWRSETYGLMRSGRSLTPFVLHALARSGRPIPPEVLEGAFAFLDASTTEAGAIAAGDGVADFPNYATGFAVLALCELRPPGWEARVRRMVEYLLADQLTEDLDWRPEDPAYGGWGFGGPRRRRGQPVEPDLSRTVVVLEALRAAREVAGLESHAVWAKARRFAETCQAAGDGGGFLFNPVDLSSNKTAFLHPERERPVPYGTATVDGLRALLLCGAAPGEDPVRRAIAWLEAHPGLDAPGGFDGGEPRWELGLRFYWWWSLARASRTLPEPLVPDWKAELAGRVLSMPHEGGLWANPVGLSREDDPLIATAFSLMILADCR